MGKGLGISIIQKRKKNRKIEKTNIFMENPKARNKKESNTKSNLNQTNKKTQQNYISYPNFFFKKEENVLELVLTI